MLRIAEFDPVASTGGVLYRPLVYGDPSDARWDGYVVFFPIGAGTVISTPRETTQPTFESLRHWAFALDAVYLEGALRRALAAGSGVPRPATVTELDLAAAELTAAGDAIALHRAADGAGLEAMSELASAEMHEEAAAAARENAERLGRSQKDLDALARATARSAGKKRKAESPRSRSTAQKKRR
jgi:hypothetical protein